MALRAYPEPQISPAEALLCAALGLEAFAADAFGRSLPADEAMHLASMRGEAGKLAASIRAGTYGGPLVLEIRGYILDSIGTPGANDVGVWDDATVYLECKATARGTSDVTKTVRVRSNVDPTTLRAGAPGRPGTAVKAAPQMYYVAEGPHRNRRGLRQASPILIDRAGPGGVEYRVTPAAWPYTNMHEDKGAGTGSAGCSTFPAGEWALLYGAASHAGRIPVVLIEETMRRAWRTAGHLA